MKHPLNIFSTIFLALALLSANGCASNAKQEGTGEYVDDAVISTRVRAQLLNEPGLSSNQINVETFKGVVQLSGFVKNKADIAKSVQIANGTPGVKSVKNDIRLR